jgi:hypothetical protein
MRPQTSKQQTSNQKTRNQQQTGPLYNATANQQSENQQPLFYWNIMIHDKWFVIRPYVIWLIRDPTNQQNV